jgi:multisubunit Na+/H+ antiporter MnhC subunit
MPMIAIALSGVFSLFSRQTCRKATIILGLIVFAVNSYLYIVANTYGFILTLMAVGVCQSEFLKPELWRLSAT